MILTLFIIQVSQYVLVSPKWVFGATSFCFRGFRGNDVRILDRRLLTGLIMYNTTNRQRNREMERHLQCMEVYIFIFIHQHFRGVCPVLFFGPCNSIPFWILRGDSSFATSFKSLRPSSLSSSLISIRLLPITSPDLGFPVVLVRSDMMGSVDATSCRYKEVAVSNAWLASSPPLECQCHMLELRNLLSLQSHI